MLAFLLPRNGLARAREGPVLKKTVILDVSLDVESGYRPKGNEGT